MNQSLGRLLALCAVGLIAGCASSASTATTGPTTPAQELAPTAKESPAVAPAAAPAAAALKAPGEAQIGDLTTCPVSKEEFKVTAASPSVLHEGKTYYFCCSGCDTRFKGDPAKYLKR